jgi:glyoxylase-like metal-dependent hydrolase (beta-lactamase superfamily II)
LTILPVFWIAAARYATLLDVSAEAPSNPITRISDDTWLLNGQVGGRPLSLPLLRGGTDYLLLDTGCSGHVETMILPALRTLNVDPADLRWIVSTHPDTDHIGGNAKMAAVAPRAMLACGMLDRQQIESRELLFRLRYDRFRDDHAHVYPQAVVQKIVDDLGDDQPVDLALTGGSIIRLGRDQGHHHGRQHGRERVLEVVHLPGHSAGHIGLLDRESATLFGADAIHGSGYLDVAGRPALCPTYLDVQPYRQTIATIRALGPACYVGCHWPVKRGTEVLAFCDESEHFVARAEAAVFERLMRSPATLSQLCHEVGPTLGDWPGPVNHELCYAIGGHLVDLEARGLVRGTQTTPRMFSAAEAR